MGKRDGISWHFPPIATLGANIAGCIAQDSFVFSWGRLGEQVRSILDLT